MLSIYSMSITPMIRSMRCAVTWMALTERDGFFHRPLALVSGPKVSRTVIYLTVDAGHGLRFCATVLAGRCTRLVVAPLLIWFAARYAPTAQLLSTEVAPHGLFQG